ncbi:adenylyl-sulfate kinase [Occallatibacter savannae]|uniref:adenylyl-sulfate kinase n=1 Tax=Occallatibacter savannae TaxID=1002691 RepID=UPI000D68C0E6|nr:adenylyl-sulfate kinase [Occallatibacter savannae]
MNSGCTLWFTGLSGSGKSTISQLVASRLRALGARVEVLDGDITRTLLCQGLGFSREDREENIRRIGFVCELLSRNDVIAIAAAISPYRSSRDELRRRIPNFIEIHMNCPVEVLIERDVKGLYKKALAGEIKQFTGISDPYESPVSPDLTIDSSSESIEAGVAKILCHLEKLKIIPRAGAELPTAEREVKSIPTFN